jgi:predicted DNA-binding transcriptional regulator YafY|tara:strand:- start:505 stop:1521 length:1017 start_codon:yes stop_codon:yes gene_type:complete
MPVTKSALLRYRIIDKTIRNKYKPFPGKERLREACEEVLFNSQNERVSASTIDKDLNAMRFDEGLGYLAPIGFSREYKGYFYKDKNYSFDTVPLNEDDLDAIRFAATTLHQFKGIKIFENFDFAIGKIFDRINMTEIEQFDDVNEFVQFETVEHIKGSEFLPDIVRSIKERLTLSLSYQSFKGSEIKNYSLHPYFLKEYRNRWYLLAFDANAKKIKTYGLDRVASITIEGTNFLRDKNFNAENFFRNSIGITAIDAKPKLVVLKFSSQQGHYVKTQPLHQSQLIVDETDTSITISINVVESVELTMTILGFGNSVKVILPKSLKEKIKNEHLKSANNQ